MLLSGISALAVGEYEETTMFTITVNDNSHTNFKAVQIFKGSQAVDGNDDNPLGDIVWGDNITSTLQGQIITAVNTALGLTGANEIASTATAQQVAMKISDQNLGFNDAKAKDLAQALGVLLKNVAGTTLTSGGKNEVPAGYYLVIDMKASLGDNDALNASLLQMTKDITITKKTDAPTVEKKIIENGSSLVETDTATIGDDISFEISSAVPDHTYYDHYYFIMNDTLSAGLTFNNDIKVYKSEPYVGDDESKKGTFLAEEALTVDSDYYVYTEKVEGKDTFKIAFNNVKALPVGTKLFARYSAKLNSNAVVGGSGNPNEADLTYSNNPDNSGRGDDTSKPGIPDSTHTTQTGTTPKERTITYTAEIDILKTKSDNTPLAGAEFTLTGTSTKTVLKSKDVYTASDSGTWYRLTAGTWTEAAPTPPSMQEAAAGATAGYVEDSSYNGTDKIVIGTKTYRPYVASTDSEKTIYVYNEGNAASYASTTQMYTMTTATETTTQTYPVKMVITSDAQGHVVFSKLGEGTYTIEETKVPAGYNKAENVIIEIDASLPTAVTEGNEKATWSVGNASDPKDKISVRVDSDTNLATIGIYDTTIVNNSGATLPSTGGIGTTIFYVAGSILVLAAAILLITKRRMGVND